MLRNYFLTAWRNLLRNRIYSLINLLGLATGVACCLLIAMYVWHQYSYDRFHPGIEQIYIVAQESLDNPGERWGGTAPIMGRMLLQDIPEIQSVSRLHSRGGLVAIGEGHKLETYQVDGITYVDSNFFTFWGFDLLQGDPNTVLQGPNRVVLPASLAQTFYGDQDPIGQILTVDDEFTFQVSGIMADVPDNSSLQPEMLVSWATMKVVYNGNPFNSWWWPTTYTYVRLHEAAPLAELNATRLPDFSRKYRGDNNEFIPSFQPAADFHLYGLSDSREGAARYVSIFGLVAIIVLLIACINFTNLSTARAAQRAREVGVRKAVGASRGALIQQFLGESFLIASLAVMLGLGLAELLLPLFNRLADLSLAIPWLSGTFWLSTLGVSLALGLLAGGYPSLFLSRFQPVHVLKASLNLKSGKGGLRQWLVVSQFVIGITLIVCTTIIWRQHQYMQTEEMGFDQAQLLNVSIKDAQSRNKLDVLEQKLESLPDVEYATPASWAGLANYMVSFPVEVEDENGKLVSAEEAAIVYTDHEWLQTIGGTLTTGRNFSEEFGTDQQEAFLVNERMIKTMGDTGLVGRQARLSYSEYGKVIYEKKGRIVGTFKDFHVQNLRNEIPPLIVALADGYERTSYLGNLAVRLRPGNHSTQLAAVKAMWEETFPNQPFEGEFVDEAIESAYQQEARLGRILTSFTVLALFIAALGLLGLAAFTAQQRTKEIGVRKVLGASKQNILLLLNREFTWLVLISLLIASPLSYYLMQEWLAEYPYRTEFSVWPFLGAGIGALLLTWLTVSIHSLRAAWMNPADALRSE